MTTQTPATAEIENWLQIWVRTKNAESCRSRLRLFGSGTTSGLHTKTAIFSFSDDQDWGKFSIL